MKIKIYTTDDCPYCVAAKNLLKRKNLAFEEVDVSADDEFDALVKKTGMKTVPQIFCDEQLIGGFQELTQLDREGKV
ncbi:MAG: glutathione S-transferase N-terminal domain-containing protein [Deltaproteobacteria bacterium]|nr:MAG: glutathione S-transferase N-terminal domain-containing protein [Deltaproteobacteria bacterium]